MSEYMLKRYHERREYAFKLLGGTCAKCGCLPTEYEFDHIDPPTKSFTIAKMWSVAEDRFLDELKKCQILCKECHYDKTTKEAGKIKAKGTHGTKSSYRYCKCDLCKKANTESKRQYRINKRMRL